MNALAYLRWFFGIVLLGAVAIGGVNAVVDPYGIFDLVRLPGVNVEKPQRLATGGRIQKSVRLSRGRYDTLILGSSRTQIGIDPKSPVLAGRRAYNAALAGTNMYELHQVGLYALAHQELKQVIFGIDFLLFSTRRTVQGDFAESGFAGRWLGAVYLRQLISAGALSDSALTLQANRLGERSAYRPDGYIDGRIRYGRTDPRSLFTGILESHFFVNPETYAAFDYGRDRMKRFHDLIERLSRRGVAVDVFISPMHAWQLEALQLLGLAPTFERWKRDVVDAVERVNGGAVGSQTAVRIWDFADYNSITTETIPPAGAGDPTRWFWESSHYKREVGELVLLRMLGGEHAATVVPADFGVALDSETLDAHLRAVRRAARAYRRNNPLSVAEVEQMFRRTEPIRRLLN